jgi:cholest-4-en-3-one 26-monooxygenase
MWRVTVTVVPKIDPEFDPTDPIQNEKAIPLDQFLAHRKNAPVWWVSQDDAACAGFFDGGFWAVSRHEDVSAVSKNSNDFSSTENGAIIRFAPNMTREQVEMQRVMLVNQDPPLHTTTRQIISRGFTPKAIGLLHQSLQDRADRIVDEALARGEGDFVSEVAAELPLQAIADLMGVPQEDRRKVFDWTNQMLAYDDPDFDGEPDVAAAEILAYSMGLADERRREPREDIVTKLVQAGSDGTGALTDDEFGFFVILLAVAGNETTRNAITHGLKAFFDNPDQWELYKKERPATAVDEIIRWATPVTVFQRTAINDVEVGGQLVKKGDRVGIFYASGNRDDEVFTEPDKFDIMRSPNPHLAFGGHGAHYCIGANLARLEVEIMFNTIADKMPNIAPNGEARRLRHSWINGIKEMQVKYLP